jgi:hypothetical protein
MFLFSNKKQIFLLLCIFSSSFGLIHDLTIKNDNRKKFFIENFGFATGGELQMTILNFKIDGKPYSSQYDKWIAFVIKRTETDSTTFIEESSTETAEECLAEITTGSGDIVIYINQTNQGEYTKFFTTIKEGQEGFYNTLFISCISGFVSFELKLTQFNIDSSGQRNYLPIGESILPTLFGVFTVGYFVLLILWIFHFIRSPGAKVNRIHHLMTLLVTLKMLSLLFETIQYHYIQTTGTGAGWSIVYYIFAGLKGIILFVLIALIGTGWSFIKPFLSEKDKKIFLVVIPLQILDNIALIIIEESAPGSQGWFTWKDIFRLVDIICCGAILIPIIWSIKHLREASQIDGKAALNMKKLTLFRQFYLIVVAYIYFTRIIVYLVDATLPFRMVWLGNFFTELATLAFFCVTGYKFRPAPDNPYFSLTEGEIAVESAVELEESRD